MKRKKNKGVVKESYTERMRKEWGGREANFSG